MDEGADDVTVPRSMALLLRAKAHTLLLVLSQFLSLRRFGIVCRHTFHLRPPLTRFFLLNTSPISTRVKRNAQ